MKDINNLTPIELTTLGNEVKAKHDMLKDEIMTDTFALENLEQKIKSDVDKLQELEKKYVDIIEKLMNHGI